jgi:hypothetical protein
MSDLVTVKCPKCGREYRPARELLQNRARARCIGCGTSFEMVPEPDRSVIATPRSPATPPPIPRSIQRSIVEHRPPTDARSTSEIPVGPEWPWRPLADLAPDLPPGARSRSALAAEELLARALPRTTD